MQVFTSYEQRTTSHGFSSDSDAAFRRDRLMIILRPCAIRHEFRLYLGFTAGRPLGVPYGIAYRRWERKRSQIAKKYTASGLVRRGRPLTSQTAFGGQLPYKGSLVRPVARFHHSLFEYNGRLLRATNDEPRATIFSRAEGHSRRCI